MTKYRKNTEKRKPNDRRGARKARKAARASKRERNRKLSDARTTKRPIGPGIRHAHARAADLRRVACEGPPPA